jgi:hypothetical protein
MNNKSYEAAINRVGEEFDKQAQMCLNIAKDRALSALDRPEEIRVEEESQAKLWQVKSQTWQEAKKVLAACAGEVLQKEK